jgi:hypothetical protein
VFSHIFLGFDSGGQPKRTGQQGRITIWENTYSFAGLRSKSCVSRLLESPPLLWLEYLGCSRRADGRTVCTTLGRLVGNEVLFKRFLHL